MNDIITKLKGLTNENSTIEEINLITEVISEIEGIQKTNDDLIAKNEQLRLKYMDSIAHGGYSQEEKTNTQEQAPKTLEECINEVVAKRK